MLKVELVVIGKLKEEYLRQACDEYIKRLGAFCRVTVTELPESRVSQNPSPSEITDCLEKEGAAILAKIPAQSYVVAMCIEAAYLPTAGGPNTKGGLRWGQPHFLCDWRFLGACPGSKKTGGPAPFHVPHDLPPPTGQGYGFRAALPGYGY